MTHPVAAIAIVPAKRTVIMQREIFMASPLDFNGFCRLGKGTSMCPFQVALQGEIFLAVMPLGAIAMRSRRPQTMMARR